MTSALCRCICLTLGMTLYARVCVLGSKRQKFRRRLMAEVAKTFVLTFH